MSKLTELFGASLASGDTTVDTDTALADCEAVGIYFSAHWCPPCRGFTPVLVKKLAALKEAGKKVAMVFASSDQDAAAFKEYFASMTDFYALPYSERDLKEKLSTKFGVRGIPTLVFVDGKTGSTITTEGRSAVSNSAFIENFPYVPKAMYDLSESTSGINDKRALIAVVDGASDKVKASATEAMQAFADETIEAFADDKERKGAQRFFTAKGGGPLMQIRKGTGLPAGPVAKHEHDLKDVGNENKRWGCDGCGCDGASAESRHQCQEGCNFDYCGKCLKASAEGPTPEQAKTFAQAFLVMLDLGDKGGFYKQAVEGDITADSLKKFDDDFVAGKLERNQWGA